MRVYDYRDLLPRDGIVVLAGEHPLDHALAMCSEDGNSILRKTTPEQIQQRGNAGLIEMS